MFLVFKHTGWDIVNDYWYTTGHIYWSWTQCACSSDDDAHQTRWNLNLQIFLFCVSLLVSLGCTDEIFDNEICLVGEL